MNTESNRSLERLGKLGLRLSFLTLSFALLGACEGDNVFSGDSSLAMPRAAVAGPDFVLAGDTFFVRVDGYAARGITRLELSLRGAMTRDTFLTYPNASTTSLSQLFRFKAPSLFADTTLVLMARVTDKIGALSGLRRDTVIAFGPPGVISVNKPDSVRAGSSAVLRVRVVGSRKVMRIDVQVRGAVTDDKTYNINPASFDVTQDIVINVPATATDTMLRVTVLPRDEANLTSTNLITVPLNRPLAGALTVGSERRDVTAARKGVILNLRRKDAGL